MNEFIKQNWFKVLLVLLLGIFIVLSITQNSNNTNETKKSFLENDIFSATQITCTYPQVLNTHYLNNEISHNIPKPETNPLIFTFSKLDDPKVGQLSYIDSTQSITNVPIIKLREDEEKIIYIDGNGENYLSVHTIYKKVGVSIYTKSVSLLGIPSGTLAMGSCVGY
ncbi:MAG: hypothetical protein Q7J54_00030 [Candidatus Woesearchaeota archaeon]|nr:hypothetical protein [Candidatus Woesearchaeota archaeon]